MVKLNENIYSYDVPSLKEFLDENEISYNVAIECIDNWLDTDTINFLIQSFKDEEYTYDDMYKNYEDEELDEATGSFGSANAYKTDTIDLI